MIEFGKKMFHEFKDGVRSMRRLSESIDQAMFCIDRIESTTNARANRPDGGSSWREGEVVEALQKQCEEYPYPGIRMEDGAVVYCTTGGLKFGWTKNVQFARNPFNEQGFARFDVQYTFYVFAKGGKFREGSRLRSALYGAGWEIVEEVPEEVLSTDFVQQLLDEEKDMSRYLDPQFNKLGSEEEEVELAGVPAKYKANLADD